MNLCGGLRAMHGVVVQGMCVVIDFTSEHDPQLACVLVGNRQTGIDFSKTHTKSIRRPLFRIGSSTATLGLCSKHLRAWK